MTGILEAVIEFLTKAQYECAVLSRGRMRAVAQNQSVIVFVVDAAEDIETAVDETLNLLLKPFKTKTFGPKSSEMYAVFLADRQTPIASIERFEQDVRICRKIVVTDVADVEQRLTFLTPLNNNNVKVSDPETLFWVEVESRLRKGEAQILRELTTRDLQIEEIQQLSHKEEE